MKSKILCLLTFVVLVSGCSTTGTFIVPKNTDLYVYRRSQPVTIDQNGKVRTKPFFWTAAGGIPYALKRNGKTIKEGKLRAKFRVVSIFWPPFAIIYWPIGFNPHITYDLVHDTQK